MRLVAQGSVFRAGHRGVERPVLILRCFCCVLLSRCFVLWRGIENVREVRVGSFVARGCLVVLVL